MNVIAKIVTILGVTAFTSCKSTVKVDNPKIKISDTTIALSALFNERFLEENMPGFGAPGIGQRSIYGDTILFEFNDSLNEHIPEMLGNHVLKRIGRDSICILSKQHNSDSIRFPNFLRLTHFQKVDSNYQVMLEASCVMPGYDRSTRKVDLKLPCAFGMMCGGGIRVAIQRSGNSVKIERLGGWSD